MASRSFEHAVRDVPGLRTVDAAAGVIARRRLRYRLAVAAPSVVEVVRFAGGWLFDQVIAGWDVMVLTAEPGDDRPLQILGDLGDRDVGELGSVLVGDAVDQHGAGPVTR